MNLMNYEALRIIRNPSPRLVKESQQLLERMNIYHKWNKTMGSGVKIAVVDTGVETSHPDLKHAAGKTFNSFTHTSDVRDVQGHGTHVAGIIFGNGLIQGVAPEADMLAVKALNDQGSGSNQSVARGIQWAVAQGADVICMSLGSDYPSREIERAVDAAAREDVICVCAAGNDAHGRQDIISIDYPAAYENTIAVGAIDTKRKIANFSSVGNVDVVSYGVDILSAFPGGQYAIFSGTSMATPYIAGCIGLIQANAKNRLGRRLSLVEIKTLLILNAADLGAPGYDKVYGYGKFKF